ncbi:hypothetical protein TRFO_28307 [Tritrichomonas foetus]|uniref:Uncharacterized protein n=1 Tax=Tritrichomonas foetus TaxID=1144522 RepID=A0A1J4JYL4_9EUKA|nr:hypothetical protein TRFO_28307 [Tritrichomonas foetus]|eukprot:OHT04255.1 hypothetical protein TRFO_28307 [Tritrichomonas foetus]
MAFVSYLKSILVLAVLGLLTDFLVSIIVTLFIVSKVAAWIIGGVLIALAVLFVFLGFFRNEDSKKRWLYIWLGIFGVVGGIIAIAIPTSYHKTASVLNRMSIYSIIAIAISNFIAQFWHFLTVFLLKDVLESKQITTTDEALVYTVVNMLCALVTSLFLSMTESTKLSDVWANGFSLSIIGWVIAAVLFAFVGFLFGRNVEVLASKYESTVAPIAEGGYTNME